MLRKFALRLINWYQNRGGGNGIFAVDCNFEPGCSEYTKQAIEHYGFAKGVRLGLARIRRCNQPDLPHKIDDPLPMCDCHAEPDTGDTSHV
ncbi:MAG: membrane protein insertion efficiency factor YidD [Woeseiaceae bacterium]|nr:membrane protein insertion efficiency factor YidD [Woeseiaceae bacterium]